MKIILTALCLFSFGLAQGQSFERFNKRYKIVRTEDGKISHIKAKGVLTGFHFMPYIQGLKKDLIALKKDILGKSQQVNMKGQLMSEVYVDQILDEIEAGAYSTKVLKSGGSPVDPKKNAELRRSNLRKAYLNLPTVDVDGAFEELKTKGFFKDILDALKKFYLQRDVSIIAAPNYKTFFFEQKAANKIASELIKIAKKKLGSIPILNIATFIVDDLLVKVEEQREISQNILLYYIVNYEEKLNLTKDETNMIVSSIYESRIPLSLAGYQTSRAAVKGWMDYGWTNYDVAPRTAENRMRAVGANYVSKSKVDFTFYDVTKGEKRTIVNAALTNHMFSSAPAESYNYAKPHRIRSLRTLVRLGQMALGFVPKVPGFIKNAVNTFSNSWYKDQAKFEAFLFAHFEAMEDKEKMAILGAQINNPFYLFF